MAKKGPKTGKKTDEKPRERDDKGRFLKGTCPGPGRGKKKEKDPEGLPEDMLDYALRELYDISQTKDKTIKLKALQAITKIKMAMGPKKDNQVISDTMINLLGIRPDSSSVGDQNEDIIDIEDDDTEDD